MGKHSFFIVDVFSQGKYTGNQLAVFTNAKSMSNNDMQQIAKEMNFSETTFILSNQEQNGGYDVRIFTPNEEVPFAGHPTLGTAFVLRNEIMKGTNTTLKLNLKAGQIPVTYDYETDVFWMKQNQPTFGQILDLNKVADVLNLPTETIDDRFPIQEVSTGLPVIIVPLKNLNAVRSVKVNKEKYFELIRGTEAKAILVFSQDTYHDANDLNVRDFADYYGVPEDAATGSSNGCLASYLIHYGYFGSDTINIRVEQGYEIERPSLLFLKANKVETGINVLVGGQVEKIAQGEWES
ncbi:MAG: PhzF family phenazine biosynthesis protein [Alicyclobacillus macrosporangiidus]|uniref:PhzF family phenazine biosynthesis protein n=1 Tax=Alicyclobacillus macrosporangiidus TaxID=392015 RepID=UPI0026EE813D|nr:PhzF family phenazine biosynthesis protein [Alicyclobacillus macrosporangiidus]MCL6601031.1 PhzF family phenazine biosynthesis protein [Alicyclobacillus macrosporangiidus]